MACYHDGPAQAGGPLRVESIPELWTIGQALADHVREWPHQVVSHMGIAAYRVLDDRGFCGGGSVTTLVRRMGRTITSAPAERRPGQHARETVRHLARRTLAALLLIVIVGVLVGVTFGFTSPVGLATDLAVIAGVVLLDRLASPVTDRWDRGADGEQLVGGILDGLADRGWLALHDVDTGRGNIDHIVIGPGGIFTIETKSRGGKLMADRVDARALAQAYAQAKYLEAVVGQAVSPLLVYSRAYIIGRPVTRQRGVCVLPARMLDGHLARRLLRLSPTQVHELHHRLSGALDTRR